MACAKDACVAVDDTGEFVVLWSTRRLNEFVTIDYDEWDQFIKEVKSGKHDRNRGVDDYGYPNDGGHWRR